MQRSIRFVCMFCLFALGASAIGTAADSKKKLDESIQKFYDAFIHSKWKTAEQYVDSESRDVFRAQAKPGILKYEVKKIEFQNGDREALVTVGVDMPIPQFANKIMTLNAQTQWRFSKGKWQMIISAPPPIPATLAAKLRPTSDNPTPDLKFDYREFDFGIRRQGDVIKIEFPFVNVTDHAVQVNASLVTECNCIEVGVSKETVAPGEKAAVQFSVRSDPFTFFYHQGIGVKVEPGNGSAILDITGFLNPADQNPPTAVPNATSEVR